MIAVGYRKGKDPVLKAEECFLIFFYSAHTNAIFGSYSLL